MKWVMKWAATNGYDNVLIKFILKVSNHIEEIEEVFNIYDEGVYYDEVETNYEKSPFPQQVTICF